ncbi:expressed unknown protein [Seminavis robusta]|uniref:Uncharacterized protein n=1 Tax=Seminavis robusta TaxID=568900 RepID=A0A9N8E7J0_9STRA|nr:expressed unknown protein [Seminavis robusta]|eukprot:Sro579_g170000.1 n/a (1272) ;mRNA; f:33538-37353
MKKALKGSSNTGGYKSFDKKQPFVPPASLIKLKRSASTTSASRRYPDIQGDTVNLELSEYQYYDDDQTTFDLGLVNTGHDTTTVTEPETDFEELVASPNRIATINQLKPWSSRPLKNVTKKYVPLSERLKLKKKFPARHADAVEEEPPARPSTPPKKIILEPVQTYTTGENVEMQLGRCPSSDSSEVVFIHPLDTEDDHGDKQSKQPPQDQTVTPADPDESSVRQKRASSSADSVAQPPAPVVEKRQAMEPPSHVYHSDTSSFLAEDLINQADDKSFSSRMMDAAASFVKIDRVSSFRTDSGRSSSGKSCGSSVVRLKRRFEKDAFTKARMEDPPIDKIAVDPTCKDLQRAFACAVAADADGSFEHEATDVASLQTGRYETQLLSFAGSRSDAPSTKLATLLEADTACSDVPEVEAILSDLHMQELGEIEAVYGLRRVSDVAVESDDDSSKQRKDQPVRSDPPRSDPPDVELVPSILSSEEQSEGEIVKVRNEPCLDSRHTGDTRRSAKQECSPSRQDPHSDDVRRDPSFEISKDPSFDSDAKPAPVKLDGEEHHLIASLRANPVKKEPTSSRGLAEPEGDFRRPGQKQAASVAATQLEPLCAPKQEPSRRPRLDPDASDPAQPAVIYPYPCAGQYPGYPGYPHMAPGVPMHFPHAAMGIPGMGMPAPMQDPQVYGMTSSPCLSPTSQAPPDAAGTPPREDTEAEPAHRPPLPPTDPASTQGILKSNVRWSDQQEKQQNLAETRVFDGSNAAREVCLEPDAASSDSPPDVRRLNRDGNDPANPLPPLTKPETPDVPEVPAEPEPPKPPFEPSTSARPNDQTVTLEQETNTVNGTPERVAVGQFEDNVADANAVLFKSSPDSTPERDICDCDMIDPLTGLPPSPRGVTEDMHMVAVAVAAAVGSDSMPPCSVINVQVQEPVEDLSIDADNKSASSRPSILETTFDAVHNMIPPKWGVKLQQAKDYKEFNFNSGGKNNYSSLYGKAHPSFGRGPLEDKKRKGPVKGIIDQFQRFAHFMESDGASLCGSEKGSHPGRRKRTGRSVYTEGSTTYQSTKMSSESESPPTRTRRGRGSRVHSTRSVSPSTLRRAHVSSSVYSVGSHSPDRDAIPMPTTSKPTVVLGAAEDVTDNMYSPAYMSATIQSSRLQEGRHASDSRTAQRLAATTQGQEWKAFEEDSVNRESPAASKPEAPKASTRGREWNAFEEESENRDAEWCPKPPLHSSRRVSALKSSMKVKKDRNGIPLRGPSKGLRDTGEGGRFGGGRGSGDRLGSL